LDWFLRSPRDGEAVLCCVVGAIGFAVGMLAAWAIRTEAMP